MARPPLLVRPLATLAAGLLVAGLVQAAPASADDATTTLTVSVGTAGSSAGRSAADPADLGLAPASAVLDVLVTNDGPEDVQGLTATAVVVANGSVATPSCDLTSLPTSDGTGPVLASGASVSCTTTVSDVAFGSLHEDVTSVSGTTVGTGAPVSAEAHFFATAGDPSVRLGDRVWRDTDRDGVQDDGEPGLPGVVLTLSGSPTAVDPQTTTTDGSYAFTGLPAGASYTVTVDPSSPGLTGLVATTATSARSADGLAPGGSDLGLDFGFAAPSAPAKATVSLTADARPEPAITGSTITVKGSITRAGKAFRTSTTLERQVDGSGTWSKVKTVKSTSKGALATTVKADRTASYRFRFAGNGTTEAGTSPADRVEVRKATVRLTVSAPSSVTKGKAVKVKGSVRREGKKYRTTTVLEFRADGASGWAKVRSVKSSKKGSLSASVKPSRSGEYRYRFAGSSTTEAGASGGDHVTVKPKPPAKPKPKAYNNCTALNKVYRHGVGRSGARDKVRGSTDPVTDFTRDTKTYNKNKKSDRDKDGIACEQP